MNKLRKTLDQYLFAPSRFLTAGGEPVDAGPLKKLFLRPETKISAFAGVMAVATLGLSAEEKNLPAATAIAATALITSRTFGSRKTNTAYYFDTAPIRKHEIPSPAIEFILKLEKDHFAPRALTSAFLSCAPGIFVFAISQSPTLTATFCTVAATHGFMEETAKYWRAAQALDGNWNVITKKPQAAPQKALSFDKAIQPRPV
ncbi:MAG: hypothetical protein DI626_01090 [Micavibrio aeruginosavorus]|uniref:Uncharacterized protein n=1 Tax=Micavibrio aeruginosavorus TaxID=349221 RepID=A0A2W5A615_9BACT|nr:MAG: hypothetical protein DI626_01090 [Micavibrio aeruginosavorus]